MLDRTFAMAFMVGLLASDLTFRLVPFSAFSVLLIVVFAAMLPALLLQTANMKLLRIPFPFLLGFTIAGSVKWLLLG